MLETKNLRQTKTKFKKISSIFLSISLLSLILFPTNLGQAVEFKLNNLEGVEIWQINQDINNKRSAIQELKDQIEVYNKNIVAKQREISSLSTQISTLNDSIAKINLEVQKANLEIDEINLKIENTQLKIQAKEKEISDQKEILAYILRNLHKEQQKNSLIEILLLKDNFSDFMAELSRLEDMQDQLSDGVKSLKKIRLSMISDQEILESEKKELDTLHDILDAKKEILDGQKTSKYYLMSLTQGQEEKYQQLLQQAKQEQEQVNRDIIYLEKIAREKLNRQLDTNITESDGLMWPITSHLITAYFHDAQYPYRHIFEHNAIDIATAQGSTVRAAESGYVAKTRNGGKTGYSYVMIVHPNGLSTVYGHINQILIDEEEFVSQGDIIGYSGGMPGTNGAGPFSTGPHLHFEVRLNGVPVNPLNYLP